MPRYWDSIDPRLWREQKDRAKGVVKQYSTKNKKLFSRELLEKISKILTHCREGRYKGKVPVLEISDYVDGDNQPYRIKLNLGLHGNTLTKLNYYPVQRLMNPYWFEPSNRTGPIPRTLNPFEVKSYSYNTCDEERIQHFEEMWTSYHREWQEELMPTQQEEEEEENIRKTLLEGLAKIPTANFIGINKVIAFGIGSPWRSYSGRYSDDHRFEGLEDRIWQHALVKDIRDYVQKFNRENVRAYVQDSRYTPEDSPVLQYMALEPLEDPMGFLDVDEHTLVYSVYARTPVMQILADAIINPPAMILWRHIAKYNGDYDPDRWDERMKWDPISPRVHNLLQKYWPYEFGKIPSFLYDSHTRLYVMEKPRSEEPKRHHNIGSRR